MPMVMAKAIAAPSHAAMLQHQLVPKPAPMRVELLSLERIMIFAGLGGFSCKSK